ncbi:MAG: carbohydrate-binding family 9-like protein [Acidobacteria bacterium]|nr:carbohydrate-binding family 9-like protein [Acidobacteriota bacterium]
MAQIYRDSEVPGPDVSYRVARTDATPKALLPGHHQDWARAQAVSWGPHQYRTTFRAVWNDAGMAVRFDAIDDRPWHTMLRRDDALWEEEVVEIFLDPTRSGAHYAEVEISPINIVTDLHVVTPWPHLENVRGWDWAGFESTVIPGAAFGLPGGSWTALAWLPWSGLASMTPAVSPLVPPTRRDTWRFNVFRIKRPHGPAEPERDAIYAAWSPPDGPSFHAPAFFRDLVFE